MKIIRIKNITCALNLSDNTSKEKPLLEYLKNIYQTYPIKLGMFVLRVYNVSGQLRYK